MGFKSKFKFLLAFVFLDAFPAWARHNFEFSKIYLKSKEEVNKFIKAQSSQCPEKPLKAVTVSSDKNKNIEVVSYGKEIKITFDQNQATALNIKCCETWQDTFKLIGITTNLPSPEKLQFEDSELFIWSHENSIDYNGNKLSAIWGKNSKSLRITKSLN